MKTNRELNIPVGSGIKLEYTYPAGARVIETPPSGSGEKLYAIANPAKYGCNQHDAKHRYMWVPADAVDFS